MSDLRHRLYHNGGLLAAIGLFGLMFTIYVANHPVGLTAAVAATAANKAVLLALVAMAQTLPVLTRGLDLSVGMVFILANCMASAIVVGTIGEGLLGIAAVLGAGALAGFLNGAIVVWGRLQPIITTLATGAIYYGIALYIRPGPGGDVQSDIADLATGQLFGVVPTALIILLGVVVLVWLPYRNSVLGRAAYAVGSNEQAAYMSGVPVHRAKLLAYTLAGFLAAFGGLMLTFNTYSGEASAPIAGNYTLNSIAAVVIGGTSLFGGWGSAIGSIFGAFVLRTIEDLLFVFNLDPLWQPLFQGVVLLAAVSLGALRVLRIRNRLELFV
ncbi:MULTISPECIES: ABC transporter permease [Phyllobacterium]|jgi:ribose transport system permease protein|uniref:ABC transporter permease n=1 Tax=Phyllobacterium sophorae TaxID=1520277 RepID=A0A2P7BLH1_9HYPH|nr:MULTISPECIES: ABC transporter permease [Phyllobacterium]PSH67317.1 ABC transporter permease [Phyllobacterium sophorae]UXN65539.1 ABC transporter permease [Phyllobacterium sp. A18/5-2]